jgi:hypothetical protein
MKSAIAVIITQVIVSEQCFKKMPVQKQYRNKRKIVRFRGIIIALYTDLTHFLGVYLSCTFNTENIEFNIDSNIQNKGYSTGDSVSDLPRIREYDPTIDERLPETVTLLTAPEGGKLYLVGTAHFSIESQNDVSKVYTHFSLGAVNLTLQMLQSI